MKAEEPAPLDSYLNQYFDHIYVVNLSHQITDRLKVSKHLKDYGINFEIFAATNGYAGEALEKFKAYQKRELGDLQRYAEYGTKEKLRGRAFIDSAGAMGYICTYLHILEDAKKSGYKRFLILEDDILLSRDFENKFKNFIQHVDNDWKILHLGATQYGWDNIDLTTAEEKGFYFPVSNEEDDYTYGSFAIALDAAVIDELIEAQSAFEAPFDFLPIEELYKTYRNKCFVAYPNIIMPDVSDSSIRQSKSQYTEALKRKWLLENFDYPLNKPSITVLISSKDNLKYYENFSQTKQLPFNLRLYFNTIEGLHPLHNVELLDHPDNKIYPLTHHVSFPESDYLVTIDKKETLEENDIVHFLEYKVGILDRNLTPLKETKSEQRDIEKGRVSVIISLCNNQKNIEKTLASVMMQDYHDIEIIIVLDKDTDQAIIEDIRENISLLHNRHTHCNIVLLEYAVNNNLATARNVGMLHSTGEYICFLDDNGIYLQGRLSKSIAKLMQTNKTTAAVYCGYIDWDSIENYLFSHKVGDLTVEILLLSFREHYLYSSIVTYRREAILNINGFDESYQHYQNFEFHLRYFEHYTIENIDKCLVQFSLAPSIISYRSGNQNMMGEKIKFIKQFSTIMPSVIETQDEILKKKNNFLEAKSIKLKVFEELLKELSNISFLRFPIQKYKKYKQLIGIYYSYLK